MSSDSVSFTIIFFKKISDSLSMENQGALIVDRIDKRAAEIGTSRPELTDKAHIAKNTFSNWSKVGTIPRADVALAIADALRCSVRWLITGENDKQEEYTLEEKNLLGKFRLLDNQGQFEVKALLEAKMTPAETKLAQSYVGYDSAEKKQA
jgi:transcriptional regulator with XRE-family HTH domain